MRFAIVLLISTFTVAAGACTDATAPRSPLEGSWLAVSPSQTTMSLHLTVTDTSVTGTATRSDLTDASNVPLTLSVTGTCVPPDVWLTVSMPLFPMYFRGVIAGSTLAGNMSGGFVPFPIIFSKR